MVLYPENIEKYYLSDAELKLFVEFVDKYNISRIEIAVAIGINPARLSSVFSSIRKNKPKKERMKRKVVEAFLDSYEQEIKNTEQTLLRELEQRREDYQKLKTDLGFSNALITDL